MASDGAVVKAALAEIVGTRNTLSGERLSELDPGLHQRRLQRALRELRPTARVGLAAHVRKALDAVTAKERDEIGDGVIRVPDGVDDRHGSSLLQRGALCDSSRPATRDPR